MQDYREVLPSNTVQEARDIWNNSLNTLRSTHAGADFPKEKLVLGMKCFRTDEKKTYTLVSLDPLEWAVEASGGSVELTSELEEAIKKYIINSQTYLGFVGKEALGRLTDWTGLFNRALFLESVDFADLGSGAHVTNMSKLFHDCVSLKTVLNINLPKDHPVKDVNGMFSGCTKLSVLDMSKFYAGNVENFSDIFSDCHELKVLDVSKWQTGRVTNMRGMFRNCWKLETLDVSKWDVSRCTDFAEMFSGCRVLRGLNLASWNTSKATAMGGMFQSCGNDVTVTHGAEINLSSFDLSNVETTTKMFAYAAAKLTIGEKMRKTGKCRIMSKMFAKFNNIGNVSIAGAGYASPITGEQCRQTIFTAFDYSSVEDMSGMFEGTYAVNCTAQDDDQTKNGLIFHVSTPNVRNISYLFNAATGAEFIDFSMDTGKVTDMRGLFETTRATTIRLRNFNTGRVGQNGMEDIFRDCRSLRYLIVDDTTFRFKLLSDVLADLPTECRFIVPRAMIATYKAQNIWKDYAGRFIAMEDCSLYGAYVKSAPT
nr:MAG TPA: protein of unknown function DUF285 [Bacteriophage sp.]